MPERRRRLALAASFAAGGVVAALVIGRGEPPATYALWSDSVTTSEHTAAGTWGPEVPAACGNPRRYAEVVVGTAGPDHFVGDEQRPRVYLGLGGDDTLRSRGAPDCFVGGPGRDVLTGNPACIVVTDDGDRHVWEPPRDAQPETKPETKPEPKPTPDPKPDPGPKPAPAPRIQVATTAAEPEPADPQPAASQPAEQPVPSPETAPGPATETPAD